jgi:hypothetical protein
MAKCTVFSRFREARYVINWHVLSSAPDIGSQRQAVRAAAAEATCAVARPPGTRSLLCSSPRRPLHRRKRSDGRAAIRKSLQYGPLRGLMLFPGRHGTIPINERHRSELPVEDLPEKLAGLVVAVSKLAGRATGLLRRGVG